MTLMPKRVEAEVSKLEGFPLAERGKFAQAYEYAPSEEELLEKRGRLFVVLDITADPAFDTALAGKLVWDSLVEEYYSGTEETPLKALERAVLSTRNRLTNLAHPSEKEETASSELSAKGEVRLNLATVVIWEGLATGEAGVLYLVRQGNPYIFLKRGGQVRELLIGEEPSSAASVLIEDGDIVILGSHYFGKSFTPATFPEIPFLEKEFKSGRQVAGLAAIILKLKVTEGVEEVEKPIEEPFTPGRRLEIPAFSNIFTRLPWKKKRLPFPSDKIKGGIKRMIQRVVGVVSTRIAHGQEVYLEKRRPEIKLPKVIAALVLIFLLSVTFTLWQQRQRTRVEEFIRLLSSAEASVTEAEDLVGLADERAKELWEEAKEVLGKAATINSKDERLTTLNKRAEALLNLIEKITSVAEKHLFYDLALQGGETQGLSLTGRGRFIYVSDGKTGATFAIKLSTPPQVEEATANEIKGARELAVGADFLYLLTGENFYHYNLKTGKKDTPLNFDRYGKVVACDLYLERNVYFLVPLENQIYKFLDLGGFYSQPLNWLKEPLVLEEAVDLAIDGSVWVLTKDGIVLKLLTGEEEPFSFKNLATPLTQPTAIYTRPNFKRLYIADGDRVAIFEKNGFFVKQFKGEVLSGLVDVWVTDDEKTLFFLTQSKIFKSRL